MPRRFRALSIIAALLVAGSVATQAEERCSGTLCDLYYGGSAPNETQPAKPAAPTPIMVPKGGILGYFSSGGSAPETAPGDASGTPTSASTSSTPTSRVRVGGGGLLGLARGDTPERCSGTLCDFYYGGPAPEKAEATQSGAVPAQAAEPESAATETASDDADPAPRSSKRRSRVVYADRPEKPRCASTPQDPWRCYR